MKNTWLILIAALALLCGPATLASAQEGDVDRSGDPAAGDDDSAGDDDAADDDAADDDAADDDSAGDDDDSAGDGGGGCNCENNIAGTAAVAPGALALLLVGTGLVRRRRR